MRGNAWSRRAEEFDALVSGKAGESARDEELLALVAALRAVPEPQARPEFVASLRTQLVAAAEREPARVEQELAARLTPRQRPGSRERRLAAVVGGFAVVSATGSMAMASQSAMPGDTLYPVKRAIENAQTNLKHDNASRAEAVIGHAESRLDEVQQLTARGADADVIGATLDDFTDQTGQASEFTLDDYAVHHHPAIVERLRAFAADSMDTLAALGPVVPEEVRPLLITATQTVRQADAAAWEACPTCAGGDVTDLPDFATRSLSAVLTGEIPDAASVTKAAKAKKHRAKGNATAGQTGEQTVPDASELPDVAESQEPVAEATKGTTTLDGTVEKVVKEDLGINGEPGLGPTQPTEADTDSGAVGTLVDGVTGIVSGLLQ